MFAVHGRLPFLSGLIPCLVFCAACGLGPVEGDPADRQLAELNERIAATEQAVVDARAAVEASRQDARDARKRTEDLDSAVRKTTTDKPRHVAAPHEPAREEVDLTVKIACGELLYTGACDE